MKIKFSVTASRWVAIAGREMVFGNGIRFVWRPESLQREQAPDMNLSPRLQDRTGVWGGSGETEERCFCFRGLGG